MLAHHIIFVFSTNGTILSYISMHISCASCQWHRQKKPLCSYVVVYSLYAVGKLSEHLNTATFMSNDYFYNQLKGKQNCFEDKIKRLSFIKKKYFVSMNKFNPHHGPPNHLKYDVNKLEPSFLKDALC